MTATDPEVDLRARILEALNTAVVPELRDDPEALASHEQYPWRRHNRHKFHIWCALCQGEAETLADAVMAAIGPEIEQVRADLYAALEGRPSQSVVDAAWRDLVPADVRRNLAIERARREMEED